MLAALRENWKYKLLALVCALALHSYVIGQSAAGQPRMLVRPLTLYNIPPTLLLDEKSLPQISITLDGPAEDVARVSDTAVTAFVDLSHAHAGQDGPFPVRVTLPPGFGSTVSADLQPSAVTLAMQQRGRRRMLISAAEPGMAPAGYTFHSPLVTPRRATVEGEAAAVNSVRQVIVRVDDDAVGTVDDSFPIAALNSAGSPVEGLTITPPSAHVHIDMVRVPVSRSLLVSPIVTGAPAFPARVTDIQVSPTALSVTGRADRLARVGTLGTAPVDVSGAAADIVRQVACQPPPGVSVVGAGIVTVTVHIAAPAVAAPAPLPAPILPAPAEPATSPAPAR